MTRAAARRPVAVIVAALAALMLVLAGCGGNNDVKEANAYVAKVNAAQTTFAQTIRRINRQVTAESTTTQDRRTLRQYIAAVDRVAGRLRDIKPPESVAPLHQRLVRSIDTYGKQVEAAASSLDAPTAERLLDAQQKLLDATQTVTRQINQTITAINQKLRS